MALYLATSRVGQTDDKLEHCIKHMTTALPANLFSQFYFKDTIHLYGTPSTLINRKGNICAQSPRTGLPDIAHQPVLKLCYNTFTPITCNLITRIYL